MTHVTDAFRQLVQRRLWPVALLLVGALVAVPLTLSKSPEPAPVSAPAADARTSRVTAATDPIVALVSDDDQTSARRVLGKRHDPFASSAPKTKRKKTAKSTTTRTSAGDDQVVQTPASGQDSSSGGETSVSPSPSPTTDTSPSEDTTTVPAGSIDVRFGSSSDDEPPRQTLEPLQALPSADEPVLVYTGLKDDGKTAIFMLGDGVTATGDGDCKPADACETIELKAGETEFLDLAGDTDSTQFELDVVKIHRHKTTVPSDQVVDGTSSTTGG